MHVPLSIDENDNFVLADEEREKTSYDGLNATSTQTPELGTSEESTTSSSGKDHKRSFRVYFNDTYFHMQLRRLRDGGYHREVLFIDQKIPRLNESNKNC